MGQHAEDILNGDVDEHTGEWLGGGEGFPRSAQDTDAKEQRLQYAWDKISALGFNVERIENQLRFDFKGETVSFFPWKGWASGKTIKDGRGLQNLLKQLK